MNDLVAPTPKDNKCCRNCCHWLRLAGEPAHWKYRKCAKGVQTPTGICKRTYEFDVCEQFTEPEAA